MPFFLHTLCCMFLPNNPTFVSSVHRMFCQQCCGKSSCSFANFKHAAIFFWTAVASSVVSSHELHSWLVFLYRSLSTEMLTCARDLCKSLADTRILLHVILKNCYNNRPGDRGGGGQVRPAGSTRCVGCSFNTQIYLKPQL